MFMNVLAFQSAENKSSYTYKYKLNGRVGKKIKNHWAVKEKYKWQSFDECRTRIKDLYWGKMQATVSDGEIFLQKGKIRDKSGNTRSRKKWWNKDLRWQEKDNRVGKQQSRHIV